MELRELRSWAGYRGLALLVRAGALLPEPALRMIERSLASVGPYLSPTHRRLVRNHMRAALGGEAGEEEISRLQRSFYAHAAASFVELARVVRMSDRELSARVELVGLEHLESAIQKGRGAILVSAHVGNSELAYRMVQVKLSPLGYKLNVVVRDQRDTALARVVRATRKSMNLLPKEGGVLAGAERLRRNEVVALVLDENAGSRGVFVEFMGRLASTHVGPAVLHWRTGAPVVPAFTWRTGQGKHVLEMWPPLILRNSGGGRADVLYNTALMAKAVEKMIRQHPEQWLWIIRRWKTRPQWEGAHGGLAAS
jgi:KDO2-lipid IV(A) lauroyltransferase